MKVERRPKSVSFIFTACIVFLALTLVTLGAFFLIEAQALTGKVQAAIQKVLQKNNLNIEIGEIHFSLQKGLAGTGVRLKDQKDGTVFISADTVHIKFNPLDLLINPRHAEASLRDIEIINPRMTIRRLPGNLWNFQRYFGKSKTSPRFKTVIRLKNGEINYNDFEYGACDLVKVESKIDLTRYPLISWSIQGKALLDKPVDLTSRGRARIDQAAGMMGVSIHGSSLPQIICYLPKVVDYRVVSGGADINLEFAWGQGSFWLENGKAVIRDADFYLPYFPKPFRVKYLETVFTPDRFQLNKAELTYQKTRINAQGALDFQNSGVKASVGVDGLDLKDIALLIPEFKAYGAEGKIDLNLKIGGRFSAPVLDGDLAVNGGKVGLGQGEFIDRLSGRITVRQNDLIIKQFHGFWRRTPIEVTGTLKNILKPSLNLKISGKKLNMDRLDLIPSTGEDWQFGNQINFEAGITGNPLKPALNGSLTIDELRYQGLRIDRVKVEFGWDTSDQDLQTNIQGEIGGGHLTAKGTIRFDPQAVRWKITGAVSGLNLERISVNPELKLTGKISAGIVSQGSWRQGEPVNFGNIVGTFEGETLVFQNISVDQVEGVLSLKDQILTIDSFQAKIDRGRVFGSLTWKDNQILADFDVENLQLHQLPLDQGLKSLDGVLKGNVVFEGHLEDLRGTINGTITRFTWDSHDIGDITGSMSYSGNTIDIRSLTAVTTAGNFQTRGSITINEKPLLKLNLISTNADLSEVLKWMPQSLELKIDGTGQINVEINGALDDPSFQGEIVLRNLQFFDRGMKEGFIQFEGDLTGIKLRKFTLSHDSSRLELSGQVTWDDFDLNITGQSFDLEILQLKFGSEFLQGTVNLNGRLSGTLKDPVLTGGITGRDLKFGRLSYREMTGKIIWRKEGLEILEAGMRQDQSSIAVIGRILLSNPVRFDLDAKVQDFNLQDLKQFISFPAGLDLTGRLNGTLKLTGTGGDPSVQVMGSLSRGMLDTIPVTGEFNLFYSNNRIILNQIQLRHGEGTLTARGVWENNQGLKIQIQLNNFPVQVIGSYFKLPFKIGGGVNSEIDLEWTLDRVNGQYRIGATALTLNQDSLGDCQLRGKISEAGLTVDEGLLTGKNGSIIVKGFLPWPGELPAQFGLPAARPAVSRELDLNLSLKQVSGSLLNNYLPNVMVQNGAWSGEFHLKGDLARPVISGEIDGKDFKVDIPGLPFPVEDLQLTVSVLSNQIQIQKAKGAYGDGKFTLTGFADFQGYKDLWFQINLSGTRIYYHNQFFDGSGDVNLTLEGTLKSALLSGNITVYNSKIGLLGVEPGGPLEFPGWSPKLDLVIKLGNNSRCRVIGFADLAIKGAIRLQGDLTAFEIDGEVNSRSGVLTLYNNAFRVREGRAVFNNTQGFNPYIEIESSVRKTNVEVFLSLKGMLNQLDKKLSSQPHLSDPELYSLLNWSQLRGDQPLTPQDVVAGNLSVLTDTLLGDFLSTMGHSLNVDYLYLEPDKELKGFRISVGNYVTDQLFLSYSQSIFNSDQAYLWNMDYFLTPNWVLGYNYSILEGDSWELAYRIKF